MIIIKQSLIPKADLGVFAKTDIPKGAYLGEYLGKRYLLGEFEWVLAKKRVNDVYSFNSFSGPDDYVYDARDLDQSNWTRYMNCSFSLDSENVIYKDTDGKIKFYARRNIKAGEELTFTTVKVMPKFYKLNIGHHIIKGVDSGPVKCVATHI